MFKILLNVKIGFVYVHDAQKAHTQRKKITNRDLINIESKGQKYSFIPLSFRLFFIP